MIPDLPLTRSTFTSNIYFEVCNPPGGQPHDGLDHLSHSMNDLLTAQQHARLAKYYCA